VSLDRLSDGDSRSVAQPLPVHRFGEYEVLGRLARGGMAELFLARRVGIEGFNKVVVLKRILPHLAEDPEFLQMFLAEARIVATLEHPNIVHVSDIGKCGEDYFFTMAYVHGKDVLRILREQVKHGYILPIEHALTIVAGVCAGLHYAHEHVDFEGRPCGIVHRDVSPSNILVTWDGHVKLVDFGIAKAVSQTVVTRAGVRKGKIAYMAPEQCRAEDVDRRADIWAIGVILYELTTLRRLFKADHELGVMHRIVMGDIDLPSNVVSDYPPELEAIVMRCLRSDPNERWLTAMDIRRAIEGFARSHGLELSEATLGQYLRGLFEPEEQRHPWSTLGQGQQPYEVTDEGTQVASVPRSLQLSAQSGPYPGWSSRSDVAPPSSRSWDSTRSPTNASQVRVPPSPRRGWWIAGAGVLLLGSLAGLWSQSGQVISLARRAASEQISAMGFSPALEPVSPPPKTGPTREQMLVLVNQPMPHLALDYERRHRLLDELKLDSDAWWRVDQGLQAHLDLIQAGQGPDPCAVFEAGVGRLLDGDLGLRPDLIQLVNGPPNPTCQAALDRLRARVSAL